MPNSLNAIDERPDPLDLITFNELMAELEHRHRTSLSRVIA
jgi:hypothetical protein